MTQEQIKKYESLVSERHEAQTRLHWLEGWSENLYGTLPSGRGPREDERFYITIIRWDNGKVVLQRDTTREVAEAEFNAERLRLETELERINREIEKI